MYKIKHIEHIQSRKEKKLANSYKISNQRRRSIKERELREYTERELKRILELEPDNKEALLELTNRAVRHTPIE